MFMPVGSLPLWLSPPTTKVRTRMGAVVVRLDSASTYGCSRKDRPLYERRMSLPDVSLWE